MGNLIIKMIMALVTKLLTERLIAKLAIRLLWFLSNLTITELDNGIVEDVANTLGVTDYK